MAMEENEIFPPISGNSVMVAWKQIHVVHVIDRRMKQNEKN